MSLKKALIIEDEDVTADTYRVFLAEDYIIFTAKNREEGKKYYSERFDLIIIDGLNGDCFELYDKLNGEFKVICTGDEDIVRRAKEEKKKVFKKPFYIENILKQMNK